MDLKLINILYWYSSYLTCWILTVLLFDQSSYFSKLMVITGLVGGFQVTYISPRFVYIKSMKIYYDGFFLKISDFIFHIVPFIYTIIYNKSTFVMYDYLLYLLTCSIYLSFNDPTELYNVSKVDLVNGFMLCHILFFLT
jgi:hypothetical protein